MATTQPLQSQWPRFETDEVDAAASVLRSGRVNYWNGTEGRTFEREFADFHNARHGIALANGTLALELALIALRIEPGDEVIVTPRSYVASASSIALHGATPVFADIDRNSGNITPAKVEAAISSRTKAILAAHLGGWPCDLSGLRALADAHHLSLIEDCAQAHGAQWQGQPVGSYGDAAAFSFCTDKIMSTGGEGGMLLLRDDAPWRRAWSYKDHGKDWDAVYNTEHPPGFRWLHQAMGSNWRLTEMQSAIGRHQLKKLPDWLEQRRANAMALLGALSELPGLRVTMPPAEAQSAWYKAYVYVEPSALNPGWDRDRIMQAVAGSGVPCLQGSCPEIYREQAFIDRGFAPAERLPVARELGETSLMFPVDHTLDTDDMARIAAVVSSVMQQAATP